VTVPHQVGAGSVTLVGAGPGDPDLMTVAGRRHLLEADVVVVDKALLVAHAKAGRRVVRLNGGDSAIALPALVGIPVTHRGPAQEHTAAAALSAELQVTS
jgi:uroporphyrin-III C-methyltransferase / precorrin-2 dehydrogenase / sirohydrochlorin ferrochelatase